MRCRIARGAKSMTSVRSISVLGVLVASAVLIAFIPALRVDAQRANAVKNVDWAMHNLDLAGSRYSTMDQINPSNVKTLTPRWLFQYGIIDGVSNQTTPVIVDGVMYVTDPRGGVYALDATDGHLLWTFDVTDLIGGAPTDSYTFPTPPICHSHPLISP